MITNLKDYQECFICFSYHNLCRIFIKLQDTHRGCFTFSITLKVFNLKYSYTVKIVLLYLQAHISRNLYLEQILTTHAEESLEL